MKLPRRLFNLTVLSAPLLVLGSLAGHANLATAPHHGQSAAAPLPSRADTHVYLLRGLFGVFSLGLDDLAKQLKAQGYHTELYGWDEAQHVIDLIRRRDQQGHEGPTILIGHSLGANAVITVAEGLNKRSIAVDLAVTFDATDPDPVPQNVAILINFWADDGFGVPVTAVRGYTGDLQNIDLSDEPGIDHTSIDSMDQFHQTVIARLESITGN
ncbi:alpha/beta hydrolase [Ancylobacter sp. FA202]|uniref:alpha/beta hydrolase n=1 Tax=Ancylobacter sp. FA202 TaxID=1111106 RepID=UPI000369BDAB|nr:alpha/beta hydrolase [Ancylobacter sp. FA202]